MNNIGEKVIEWNKKCWSVFKDRPVLFCVIGLVQTLTYVAIGVGIYSIYHGNYILAIGCGAYIGGFVAFFLSARRMYIRRCIGKAIAENLKSGNYTVASL